MYVMSAQGSGIEGIGVDFEVDVDQWASQYARRVGRVLQCLALQSTWSVCGVERETSAGGRLREVYSQLEDDRNLWRLMPMLVPSYHRAEGLEDVGIGEGAQCTEVWDDERGVAGALERAFDVVILCVGGVAWVRV